MYTIVTQPTVFDNMMYKFVQKTYDFYHKNFIAIRLFML